jgi:hypothetical protein
VSKQIVIGAPKATTHTWQKAKTPAGMSDDYGDWSRCQHCGLYRSQPGDPRARPHYYYPNPDEDGFLVERRGLSRHKAEPCAGGES